MSLALDALVHTMFLALGVGIGVAAERFAARAGLRVRAAVVRIRGR